MGSWMTLFIVADLLIMGAVMFYLLRRRMLTLRVQGTRTASPVLSIESMRALSEFANTQHERIANYLQANWSGAPEQLPGVLERLLDSIEHEARAKGITADRDTLKSVMDASLRAHKLANGGEVREALAKVA